MRWDRDPQTESVQMAGESVPEPIQASRLPGLEMSGRELLQKWLNKSMRIQMTDGRVLVGIFVCTDQDRNVILGSSHEYLSPPENSTTEKEEPRVLGLAMVPGHHIVSIHIDEESQDSEQDTAMNTARTSDEKADSSSVRDKSENNEVSSKDTTDRVSLKRLEDTKVDLQSDDTSEPACAGDVQEEGSQKVGKETEDSSTIQNEDSPTKATKDSLPEAASKEET